MNANLSRYRRFLGISQTKMAEIADICLTTYRYKETGEYPFTQTEIVKIYKYMKSELPNVTIEELFFAN